jgi:hypothetical protein
MYNIHGIHRYEWLIKYSTVRCFCSIRFGFRTLLRLKNWKTTNKMCVKHSPQRPTNIKTYIRKLVRLLPKVLVRIPGVCRRHVIAAHVHHFPIGLLHFYLFIPEHFPLSCWLPQPMFPCPALHLQRERESPAPKGLLTARFKSQLPGRLGRAKRGVALDHWLLLRHLGIPPPPQHRQLPGEGGA